MKTMDTEWYIYIVECADKSFYTGITTDLYRRIDEHNESEKGAKYTIARRPVRMVYFEMSENRSMATKRENEIKNMSRQEKMVLIRNF